MSFARVDIGECQLTLILDFGNVASLVAFAPTGLINVETIAPSNVKQRCSVNDKVNGLQHVRARISIEIDVK